MDCILEGIGLSNFQWIPPFLSQELRANFIPCHYFLFPCLVLNFLTIIRQFILSFMLLSSMAKYLGFLRFRRDCLVYVWSIFQAFPVIFRCKNTCILTFTIIPSLLCILVILLNTWVLTHPLHICVCVHVCIYTPDYCPPEHIITFLKTIINWYRILPAHSLYLLIYTKQPYPKQYDCKNVLQCFKSKE